MKIKTRWNELYPENEGTGTVHLQWRCKTCKRWWPEGYVRKRNGLLFNP